MNCDVCEQHLTLGATDVEEYEVCNVCNVPYHKGTKKIACSEDTLKIIKKFKEYLDSLDLRTINLFPGAYTLQDSDNNITTDDDWKLWNDWYAKNKQLFPKPEMLISADKEKFEVTRISYGKEKEERGPIPSGGSSPKA